MTQFPALQQILELAAYAGTDVRAASLELAGADNEIRSLNYGLAEVNRAHEALITSLDRERAKASLREHDAICPECLNYTEIDKTTSEFVRCERGKHLAEEAKSAGTSEGK